MMIDMVAFEEGPCLHNQIHLGMRLSQQQTKGKIDTHLSSYLGFPFPPLLPHLWLCGLIHVGSSPSFQFHPIPISQIAGQGMVSATLRHGYLDNQG